MTRGTAQRRSSGDRNLPVDEVGLTLKAIPIWSFGFGDWLRSACAPITREAEEQHTQAT